MAHNCQGPGAIALAIATPRHGAIKSLFYHELLVSAPVETVILLDLTTLHTRSAVECLFCLLVQ